MHLTEFHKKLFEIRGPLLIRFAVFSVALLPVPMLRTGWAELVLFAVLFPVSGALESGLEIMLWGILFSSPLIALFLTWSLPGADRPGVPRRSIGAMCCLIVYYPIRLYNYGIFFDAETRADVVRMHAQFPAIWLLKNLDAPLLVGLIVWAMLRRRTAIPTEKILLHYLLFLCAVWAACSLIDSQFGRFIVR